MLEVQNLSCVRGTRLLFNRLSFSAAPGELIELRGENGSGKTSLLRILSGLSTPAEGEVRWRGKNIRSLGEDYAGAVAYLAHQNGVKDELTSIENLRIANGVAGNAISNPQARAALERVGLSRQMDLPVRALSAGQRRRLALARMLTSKATVWILDEVLTSLDDSAINLSRQFISDHLKDGGIAIIATHQELNMSAGRIQQINLSGGSS